MELTYHYTSFQISFPLTAKLRALELGLSGPCLHFIIDPDLGFAVYDLAFASIFLVFCVATIQVHPFSAKEAYQIGICMVFLPLDHIYSPIFPF